MKKDPTRTTTPDGIFLFMAKLRVKLPNDFLDSLMLQKSVKI